MYEVIYEFKNIFKKLKLFKMIFEAEMPLFFLIKYRKIKKKRVRPKTDKNNNQKVK